MPAVLEAIELKAAGPIEAIRPGMGYFCQDNATELVEIAYNDFPLGRGFVVFALFSVVLVSTLVFVAVSPPQKKNFEEPKAAEERPTFETEVYLLTAQLAGTLTSPLTSARTVAPNMLNEANLRIDDDDNEEEEEPAAKRRRR